MNILSPFEEAFVGAYMGKAAGNSKRALAMAMEATDRRDELARLKKQGQKFGLTALGLRNNARVKSEILKRTNRLKRIMQPNEVLQRITTIARTGPLDYVRIHPAHDEAILDDGKPVVVDGRELKKHVPQTIEWDIEKIIADGATWLVKGFKQDPTTGEIRLEFHDAQKALEDLAKIHGLEDTPPPPPAVVNVKNQIAMMLLDPEARRHADELAKMSTRQMDADRAGG